MADIISIELIPAIAFNDTNLAQSILRSVSKMDTIDSTVLLDSEGREFASAGKKINLTTLKNSKAGTSDVYLKESLKESEVFLKGRLIIFSRNLILNKETVGRVILVQNALLYHQAVKEVVMVSVLFLLIGLFAAITLVKFVGELFQSVFSPFSELLQEVTDSKDYSERVDDNVYLEVKPLAEAFNHMLQAISSRDNMLQAESKRLSRTVKMRTRELEQTIADLTVAKAAAEAANSAKDNFLATMSHELKTPLNGILGVTNLLLSDSSCPNAAKDLLTIKRCAKNLGHIIDEILAYTFVKEGKVSLRVNEFNFLETIHETLIPFRRAAESKELVFSTSFEFDGIEVITADKERIIGIICRLLENAIKYTHQGYVRLNIQITSDTTRRYHSLHGMVADSGIGIPDTILPSIFEPFKQAEPAMTRQHSGIGLGLAITSSMIQSMGGDISVSKNKDGGCIFSFIVPVQISDSELLSQNQRKLSDLKHNHSVGEPAKPSVLLYGDNKRSNDLTYRLLDKSGYDITSFSATDELLEHLSHTDESKLNVILLEASMDVELSAALIAQMRAGTTAESQTQVIVLTSDVTSNASEVYKNAGASALLYKPFEVEDLENTIQDLAKKH